MRLPCRVEMPLEYGNFFDREGALPPHLEDNRRVARFYFRAFAALMTRQSLPALARAEAAERICLKDVSRTGISFLHCRQLFPSERAELILMEGSRRSVVVSRCRKIQDHCYEIGASFAQ
jgi:hypothetical protein